MNVVSWWHDKPTVPLGLPRAPFLLLVGLALHVFWVAGISRASGVPVWLWWAPVAADLPIALFLLANRAAPGVVIILVGLGLNLAAMAANGGLMPIALANVPGPHIAARFDGERLRLSTDRVVGPDAPLAPLGDVFIMGRRGGGGATVSIGDLVILGGALVVAARFVHLGIASDGNDGPIAAGRAVSAAD